MNDPLIAFEHAAGFSASTFALFLAGLCSALLMFWVLWTCWSGFRGMKNNKVSKDKFRRMVFRSVFIFLVLQWFLYYGVL
ncbi:integrating conjugative element protein (plasmid) [Vibrio azureus]|nr:integrating conjugative element protein [Vibrio azureus]